MSRRNTKEVETPMEISEKGIQSAPTRLQTKGKEEARPEAEDIVDILRNLGHRVHSCSKGITLGVRLEAIPRTHSVHVEITHVVDLRSEKLWKTRSAMMAAILGHANRPLLGVLEEVGLQESLTEKSLLMPWGRIGLPMLLVKSGKTSSIVVETRWVYVIYSDVRPSTDLTWLTDTRRILRLADFALSCQSDMRSSAAKLRSGIAANKKSMIRDAVANGWYGVLAIVASLGGLLTAFTSGLEHASAMTMPLVMAGLAAFIAARLLLTSRTRFNEVVHALKAEDSCVSNLGDSVKIRKSAAENRDSLRLLEDLGFVVSPLMVIAAEALKARDVDSAVSSACSVLDECVRLSPNSRNAADSMLGATDEGLGRFLGLMKHLGAESEEENLALAYVGLTAHLSSPIGFDEVVVHLTSLTNALYDVGVITSDSKEKLDGVMNKWAMKTVANQLEESLRRPDDSGLVLPQSEVTSQAKRESSQPVTGGRRIDRGEDIRQTSGLIHSTSGTAADSKSPEKLREPTMVPKQESLEISDLAKSGEPEGQDPPETAGDVVKIRARKRAEEIFTMRRQKSSVKAAAGQLVDGPIVRGEENDGDGEI